MWGKRNRVGVTGSESCQGLAGLIELLQQAVSDGGAISGRTAEGFADLLHRAQQGEEASRLLAGAVTIVAEAREYRNRRLEDATSQFFASCRDLFSSIEEAIEKGCEVSSAAQRAARNLRYLDENCSRDDLWTAIGQETKDLVVAVKAYEHGYQGTYIRAQEALNQVRARLLTACSFSRTDPLTGLPSRRAFEGYLISHLGDDGEDAVAVGLADIANFAGIDHALGPTNSDQLLRDLAASLKEAMNPGGFVARIGGNTFAIAFAGSASELASRLKNWAASLPRVDGERVQAVYVVKADDPCPSASTLISDLEDALLAAKRRMNSRRASA